MDDTIEQVSSKVLSTNISALNETYSLLDLQLMDKAVDYLIGAERIIFYGVGSSLITALEAKIKFMRIFTGCIICGILQENQGRIHYE